VEENLPDLRRGLSNLEKQIENILIYRIPVVVAVNRFETDTLSEIKIVLEAAQNAGAHAAVVSEAFARGGEGALEMAEAVSEASGNSSSFTPLYQEDLPVKDKIELIARKIYGASRCLFTPLSEKQIDRFTELGFHKFPVCMAKTHLSLSHNPDWKNRPRDFEVPVQNVEAAAGAGYLYAFLGDIMTMPGLPTVPGGTRMDIDENGKIAGLF
jgi:formyltetrahydrofolate synthetase